MAKTKITPKHDAAVLLCNQFKRTSTNALADKLYSDNRHLFKDREEARSAIRYVREQIGKKNRANMDKSKSLVGTGKYNIPEPDSKDYKPLILNSRDNNIGVISDLHIPNHRKEPIELALSYFKKQKVNTILLNGDILDNTPFSKWGSKPIAPTDIKRWFDMAENILALFRKEFPKARIIWLEGNHDYWYYKWLIKKAAILFGDEYFHLRERLHLDKYKIEYLPQEQYLMAGKLAICHGHHIIKGVFAPVNAARGAYLRAKRSVLIGHVHNTSEHTEPDLHGDIVTTWSTGCTCSLTPDYQPMAGKACHGFAHVVVHKNKNFTVRNFRIHKGQML